MAKTPNFRPDFGLFGPNMGPSIFFGGFYLYQMLNIVASYHRIQFKGKLMIQTQENGKKPHSGPNLGLLSPNYCPQIFFVKLVNKNCPKLSSYAI